MAEASVYSPLGERSEGGLYSKLVLLTGVRLAVGTALLAATAWPTLGHEPFPQTVEALLFAIVALIYFASLIFTFLLRTRRHLGWVAHGQLAADVIAATGLVYLTGGAESIFTVLYPLAIVSGAIGLGRRGAALGAATSCVAFCVLAWSMQIGIVPPAAAELDRVPLAPGKLAVVMAANLSAFMLVGGLSSLLAEQLQGARSQLLRSETRLEALEAIYSAVVRSIASGILTLGEDGRITYLNPAAEHLTGVSDRTARGQPLRTLLPDLATSIGRPRERGRPEVRLRAHDGRDRILGYATAPLAGGASGQVILFQDLTELRQMEEAVRRADRLAVVGGLAAGLAHEIRNPLASMCGSIEILGASPGLDEQERRLMSVVRSEAERLEALVREFLSFARPISPAFEPLDATRAVMETVELFRQQVAERGIELVVQADSPVWVRADPGQLKQVLWNLLGNAADATPRGGRVEVRILRQAGEGILEVEDTGHGIADEDLQRIFDPFFTTKERGTGLGLAIVHRIVEAHSGHLSVNSEAGRGTTFRVALPVAAAHEQHAPAVVG
ncbi:MAG TPA: ATP-binding protein [Myxococcales bacterium]|nr:ATP-binding protein [Myxococcales bacterium]